MKKALFFHNTGLEDRVYGPKQRKQLNGLVELSDVLLCRDNWQAHREVLSGTELILSSWGAPVLDEEFLAAAPKLEAIFYGAGSIRGFATDAGWDRGIRITSAYAANAVPVAEFTVSQIIFCLKRGWFMIEAAKDPESWVNKVPMPGAYETKVGIISLGMIGRLVCEMLKSYDVEVLAYDPYADDSVFEELGAQRVASLEEIFTQSDIVSLHAPWLPATEGMIDGRLLALLKENASFINTSRGALVREPEMIEVMRTRPDLTAVLDVTWPEPPPSDSPLFELPNIIITPHIAGSMHLECRRMGQYMVDELTRYLNGDPMKWEITRETAKMLA